MKKGAGLDYLCMALYAFAGLGFEVIWGLVLEPMIYGVQMREWSVSQNIIHWVVTCIAWGSISAILVRYAKKRYGFGLFKKGSKMKLWQWGVVLIIVIASLMMSYHDWNGPKLIKEFYANGWLKFIFQYIYYVFETILMALILIFGQMAFEQWFHKRNLPYGGIVLGLTWGVAHFFTQDIDTGITCVVMGFVYGCIYLLTNRDIRKVLPILFITFVL